MHKINIASTVIRVTDPCYDRNTSPDLVGLVGNVMPGEWQCEIFVEGGVPARIQIKHLWVRGTRSGPTGFAGVDSGQCGFIDEIAMPETVGDYEDNGFYRQICDETLENGFIVGENFFFSGTAYGDGTYRWDTMTNEENEVVSITLYFVEEDEDEEDYDQDEEDEDYGEASDEEEDNYTDMEEEIRVSFEEGENDR